jgi:Fe-S-cluster-containing hydrogenase component 2
MEGGGTFAPLDRYKTAVSKLLKANKYKPDMKYLNSTITYKMLATLSGIGWIGKCAVLTTKEWGNALRITAVATNAPLECGTPVIKSQCPPDCNKCADVCHVNAIKRNGILWERFPDGTGVHRDEFFDVALCRKGRKQHDPFGSESICGKCIAACPFTIKAAEKNPANKNIMPIFTSNTFEIVDLPNEKRTGVVKIINPGDWCVAFHSLSKHIGKTVTIKYSADVKRTGAEGNLMWQINNKDYPVVGDLIENAKTDVWHSMSGEWTGELKSGNAFYLTAYNNNSSKTTYYIDKFKIDTD